MLSLFASGGALAAIPGRIIKTDGTVVEGENIRWRGSMRQYVIKRGNVELNIDLDDVERVAVQEPPGLRSAATAAQRQPAAAIPALQQIVRDYTMLYHDVTAARWLGAALLKSGRAGEAAGVLQGVVDNYGFGRLPGELISVYLDALTESGKTAKVKSILKIMIEEGSRGAAAVALVKRGDLFKKEGKYREALIDGYLRAAVLFEDEKNFQPEALYNAAACFEELGQAAHAEKMRKKLMAEYPQSTYTRRVQSGS
jgi:TolA-binding protein